MKQIFSAVLNATWKRKESKLFMAFSMSPLLYLISTFMKTGFMNITSLDNHVQLSFLEMYDGIFNLTFSSTLPTLALFFVVIAVFKSEIQQHLLFLYKDLEKTRVLVAKLLSILTLFLIFVLNFTVLMFGVYYLRIIHLPFGSGELIGSDGYYAFFSTIGTILLHFCYIFCITLISLYSTNIVSMISGIALILITGILPLFGSIGFLVPNGYRTIAETGNFGFAFLGMVVTTLLYCGLLYYFSLQKFKKVEF